MRGHIEQRAKGSWSISLYLGKDNITNKKKYKWEMKRLKKMKVNLPRNGEYPDVVLADYQDSLEKQWVAQLKKKYKVVVFHSMLTTLNIH